MPVSVVIPAYRAVRTIRRAVDSVLNQTLAAAEIIVVDDGSPDGEELAIALLSYGPRVRLLRKENGGASSARNFGIANSHGEWVAFLDADDYWEPEKLARQRAVADAFPEVQIVGCCWFMEPPGLPRYADHTRTLKFAGRLLNLKGDEAFRAALAVWTGSLMIRRHILRDQNFVSGLEPAEDRDLWFRLLSKNTAYILTDSLATCVLEPGSLSRTNIDRDCSNMLAVIERHADAIGAAAVRHHSAVVYKRWSGVHLAEGRPAKAFPVALRRYLLQPFAAYAGWMVLKTGVLTVRDSLRVSQH